MTNAHTIGQREVTVAAGGAALGGTLAVPADAEAIVLFAHGSGSSRFSKRNQFVASELNKAGQATLLFDLLTEDEGVIDDRTRRLRFDIGLLGERLTGAVDWVAEQQKLASLTIGLFGASTGAAATLITAAERPDRIGAVVSRGGRPDLAGEALPRVKAPVLLIIGENDESVIELNREAAQRLHCQHHEAIVPGATHLFEEPGALEQVAELAQQWFTSHLLK